MLIHDILDLKEGENVYFAEDSYAALKNNNLSLQYLENIQNDPDVHLEQIVDENDHLIAIILLSHGNEGSPDERAVFTNIVSSIHMPNDGSKRFSEIARNLNFNKKYRTEVKKFREAVIEYYS